MRQTRTWCCDQCGTRANVVVTDTGRGGIIFGPLPEKWLTIDPGHLRYAGRRITVCGPACARAWAEMEVALRRDTCEHSKGCHLAIMYHPEAPSDEYRCSECDAPGRLVPVAYDLAGGQTAARFVAGLEARGLKFMEKP